MNYTKIYDNLIFKAKNRILSSEIYSEKHHILPKCLGGKNNIENIVILTAREHFIAHKLLKKIYPNYRKLAFAFFMMNVSSKNHKRITGKKYEILKKNLSELSKGSNNPMYGKTHTLEAREKIAKSKIGKGLYGNQNGMYGKSHTLETKQKLSKALKGKNHPWYGSKHTLEAREKISKSKLGKPLSEETKKKLSKHRAGEGNVNAKLTAKIVKEIRNLYSIDPILYSQKYLAKKFGVKQAAISKIITNRTWKNVV